MSEGRLEMGVGKFSWSGAERRVDRYGSCGLWDDDAGVWLPLLIPEPGVRGWIEVEVLETRKSSHIGDLFHGFFPVTPEVGEVFRLSAEAGTVVDAPMDVGFSYERRSIALAPDDGRDTFWLDPAMLYRAHDQTVRLVFVFEEAS